MPWGDVAGARAEDKHGCVEPPEGERKAQTWRLSARPPASEPRERCDPQPPGRAASSSRLDVHHTRSFTSPRSGRQLAEVSVCSRRQRDDNAQGLPPPPILAHTRKFPTASARGAWATSVEKSLHHEWSTLPVPRSKAQQAQG